MNHYIHMLLDSSASPVLVLVRLFPPVQSAVLPSGGIIQTLHSVSLFFWAGGLAYFVSHSLVRHLPLMTHLTIALGWALLPVLAQASPPDMINKFLDVLAPLLLASGSIIIAYGGYEIHRGRLSEGLHNLLAGLIVAMSIPLMRYFLRSIAGVNV